MTGKIPEILTDWRIIPQENPLARLYKEIFIQTAITEQDEGDCHTEGCKNCVFCSIKEDPVALKDTQDQEHALDLFLPIDMRNAVEGYRRIILKCIDCAFEGKI